MHFKSCPVYLLSLHPLPYTRPVHGGAGQGEGGAVGGRHRGRAQRAGLLGLRGRLHAAHHLGPHAEERRLLRQLPGRTPDRQGLLRPGQW